MKTHTFYGSLRRAVLLGTALFAFACSQEMDFEEESLRSNAPETGARVVHFQAGAVETKAQFGTPEDGAYPTLWTANDSQVKLSLNYGSAIPADVVPSQDYRSANFAATIDFSGTDGPYTFYCVSPASAAQALSPSREAWKVTIPCEQWPTTGSVDEAGLILASTSLSYDSAQEVENVNLFFSHLTAYGRLSLSNLNLSEGEAVTAVELTITTPFVGDWYWHTSGSSITDFGASSTLTIHTSLTSDIWFACAPVDVSEQAMIVTVYTTEGSYAQLVEFPANRKFNAGYTAVFTVNMDGADFTAGGTASSSDFTLVTDVSSLKAGDEVLLVCTSEGKALGALNSSGNFRDPVDISVSGTSIASAGTATVLTLEAGSVTGTWAFKDGDNYLCSASSSNYLRNSTTRNANSSWSIDIESSGLATIQAQAGSSTYLSYNSGSPRFSCYSNTNQKKVSIYRRTAGGGGVSASDPMLQYSDYGCYLGTGLEWILQSGTDQVTRSYNAEGVLTYTLINPDTVEELEISGYKKTKLKGDNFTVSVNWRRGTSTVLSQDYSMTLIKEQGPKVWLSDGSGKGVIIKK